MQNPLEKKSPSKPDYSIAKWFWQCDDNPWAKKDPSEYKWQEYSNEYSMIIESAFVMNEKFVELNEYKISFEGMIQYRKDDPKRSRRVKRDSLNYTNKRFAVNPPLPVIYQSEEKCSTRSTLCVLMHILNNSPEVKKTYKKLFYHELEARQPEFQEVVDEITESLLRAAEYRENLVKIKFPEFKLHYTQQANIIIKEIKSKPRNLREFISFVIKVYATESFISHAIGTFFKTHHWKEISLLSSFIACIIFAFHKEEFCISQDQVPLSKASIIKKGASTAMYLYRGFVIESSDLQSYSMKKVNSFSWNSIISTTRNKNLSIEYLKLCLQNVEKKQASTKIPVLFEIEIDHISKHIQGMICMSPFARYEQEQEVIITPGYLFQIISEPEKKDFYHVIKLRALERTIAPPKYELKISREEDYVKLENLTEAQVYNWITMNSDNYKKMDIKRCRFPCSVNKYGKRISTDFKMDSLEELSFDFENERVNNIVIEEIGCCISKCKNISTLKINLSYCQDFDSDSLAQLCAVIGTLDKLKILELRLKGCKNLTEKFFYGFGQSFSKREQLRELILDLSDSSSINDACISNLAQNIVNLKYIEILRINFANLIQIKDKGLQDLSYCLKNLKTLKEVNFDFSSCSQITDTSTKDLSASLASLPILSRLSLSFGSLINSLTDECTIALCEGISQIFSLRYLTLEFFACINFTDRSLFEISKITSVLTSLEEINIELYNANLISSEGFEFFIDSLSSLKLRSLGLDFSYCNQIQDKSFENLCILLKQKKYLQSLKLLFSHCPLINKSLKELTNALKVLTSIEVFEANFNGCEDISDDDIRDFSNLKNFSNLQDLSLNFAECYNITDEGIRYLCLALNCLAKLKNLELNFAYCINLTDDGFGDIFLGLKSMQKLRRLSLIFRGCYSISDPAICFLGLNLKGMNELNELKIDLYGAIVGNDGICGLSRGMINIPELKKLDLNISFCSKISNKGLVSLFIGLRYLENLTHLKLSIAGNDKINQEAISYLKPSIKLMRYLNSLNLDFSSCSMLNHLVASEISNIFGFLDWIREISLNFSNCKSITDHSIRDLSYALEKYKRLKTMDFNFYGCVLLSERTMSYIIEILNYLEDITEFNLNLGKNFNITNQSLLELSEILNKNSTIRKIILNLKKCNSLEIEDIRTQFEKLKKDNILHVMRIDL